MMYANFLVYPNLYYLSLTKELSSNVILVDPNTKEVMAQASRDTSHPLKHAVMLCLDNLARVQGGGAWRLSNAEPKPLSGEGERKEETPLSGEGGRKEDTPLSGPEEDKGVTTERGEMCPPAKRARLQYLATGYDAYCSVEPCLM